MLDGRRVYTVKLAPELLRRRLLGNEVSVTVDYVLPANADAGLPGRDACTVIYANTCALLIHTSHSHPTHQQPHFLPLICLL